MKAIDRPNTIWIEPPSAARSVAEREGKPGHDDDDHRDDLGDRVLRSIWRIDCSGASHGMDEPAACGRPNAQGIKKTDSRQARPATAARGQGNAIMRCLQG